MTGLDSIKVSVEESGRANPSTQNVLPILHEIRHALNRLVTTGEPTTIDLTAIPFGPGDKNQLYDLLGTGEIDASLNSLGKSTVRETAYPGIWLVQHFSPQGDELTTHIEVTRIPNLLVTPEGDLAESLQALTKRIQTGALN